MTVERGDLSGTLNMDDVPCYDGVIVTPPSLCEVLEVVVDELDEAGLLVAAEHAQHLVLVRRAGVQHRRAAPEEHHRRHLLLHRGRVQVPPQVIRTRHLK